MAKINNITTNNATETLEIGQHLSFSEQDIAVLKEKIFMACATVSPAEFAAFFGKEVQWALGRMKDGSVTVLDEFAKVTKEGIRFSKSARIPLQELNKYQQSLVVDIYQ